MLNLVCIHGIPTYIYFRFQSNSRYPSGRTRQILNLLNIPRYEIQGLSNFERNEALKRLKDIKKINSIDKQTTLDSQIAHNVTEEKNQYVSTWLSNTNQDLSIVEREHLNSSTLDR